MNVLIFGATGMIGQGCLRECLADPGILRVLAIGRGPAGVTHAKLTGLVHKDLWDYSTLEAELTGIDACFFCLGPTSLGMDEASYTHITHDITLAAAETLARLNPDMTFVYVSATGADSSEQGSRMWARVKGRTEKDLFKLPFKAFAVRPAFVQPLDGIRSRTPAYQVLYTVLAPLAPLLRRLFPAYVTTTQEIGRAMIALARHGSSKRILENRDFAAAAAGSAPAS
ncbi:NAD(P)H-binding protein [Phreatobacter stygius]|uniref:Epimerase n=1 Tax=Phreatobacter stygius TaxID=1940610 RepID=A0A4D7APX2_9HYPH|nr:NAD(P)H-binding protein [Phreatobacter stygius]QCI63264.1 epimerase [Phreatobacter stygius]